MNVNVQIAPSDTKEKRAFIRATEIWKPAADGRSLEWSAGLYGALSGFEALAKQTSFGFGEGLPGKAWAERRPIVLKDLVHSYFKRGEAAQEAGLTCGVALPIFGGDDLKAVVVFFCGGDDQQIGALEVWHAPVNAWELALSDGYYGAAEVFEWTARHVSFGKGVGLPGLAWSTGAPVIMERLIAPRFLRWEKAAEAGITRGVAIPCPGASDGVWVLAFLSALRTPIAIRCELWSPDGAGSLQPTAGYCEREPHLLQRLKLARIAPREGVIGKVWASGTPAIATNLSNEPTILAKSAIERGLGQMIALPVFSGDAVVSVLAWYL
ncbi:MAG: GAF domain-containing protein [Methylobacteriaceae bacterium]|nr:GAF domain-containing protein [Methylobacteriaceae bacterium]